MESGASVCLFLGQKRSQIKRVILLRSECGVDEFKTDDSIAGFTLKVDKKHLNIWTKLVIRAQF